MPKTADSSRQGLDAVEQPFLRGLRGIALVALATAMIAMVAAAVVFVFWVVAT